MKKRILFLAVTLIFAVMFIMAFSGCENGNGTDITHRVEWIGAGITATADGELITSPAQVNEGYDIIFSWIAPALGFRMRITIGNATYYRERAITTFAHNNLRAALIVVFAVVPVLPNCAVCNDSNKHCVECCDDSDCEECCDGINTTRINLQMLGTARNLVVNYANFFDSEDNQIARGSQINNGFQIIAEVGTAITLRWHTEIVEPSLVRGNNMTLRLRNVIIFSTVQGVITRNSDLVIREGNYWTLILEVEAEINNAPFAVRLDLNAW